MRTVSGLALASLASTSWAANTTIVDFTGPYNVAKSAPAECAPGVPAYQTLIMNTDMEPEDVGLSMAGIPAFTTQAGGCGYSGVDSAGGSDWLHGQDYGIHPASFGEGTARVPYEQKNGGIPYNLTGGLPAHVKQLNEAIEKTLPIDFDGIISLDYEGWQPVWDNFLFGGYKNFSMQLVLEQHPEWSSNMTHVEEVAAQQFESAGKDFYLTTIDTIKKARPKAQVAFYSTPFKGWHSYFDPEYTASQEAHNNALQWLWNAVDALSPELYLNTRPPSKFTPNNISFARAMMGESQRLVDQTFNQTGKKIGIVPFSWMRAGGHAWLPTEDLEADFLVPFEYPACWGILVWGDPAVGDVGMPALQSYYQKTFRPWALKTMKQRCDCQATKCSNHGRCVFNDTACACAEGWTGDDCSKKVSASGEMNPAPALRGASRPSGGPATYQALADTYAPRDPPAGSVTCPDGVAYCPAGNTCGQLTTGMWACCPLPDAVNCGTHTGCCPKGTLCDNENNVCYDPNDASSA